MRPIRAAPLVFFAAVYVALDNRIVLFPRLMVGIDWPIPVDNSQTYVASLITPWSYAGLGSNSLDVFGPKLIAAWLQGLIFGAFSISNNLVIAQKLFLAAPLFASIAMFYFLKLHATKDGRACLVGAILYAYSPVFSNNIGTGLIWGMALVPVAMHFLLLMFQRGGLTEVLGFTASYSVSGAFANYNLLLIPLIGGIWLGIAMLIRDATNIRTAVKSTILSIPIVLAMNPPIAQLLWGVLSGGHSASQTIPVYSIQEFYSNYGSLSIVGTMLFEPWVSFSFSRPLGFLVPIVAVSAIAFAKETSQRIAALACGVAYAATIGFIDLVSTRSPIFPIIYAVFPLISFVRGPHGILNVSGFIVTWMIAISVAAMFSIQYRVPVSINKRRLGIGFVRSARLARAVIPALIIVLVLTSSMLYNPVFHPFVQSAGQGFGGDPKNNLVSMPDSYRQIAEWLQNQNDKFRYMLVPSPFTSLTYLPYESPRILGATYGNQLGAQFVTYAEQSLLEGSTHWGQVLGATGVKYIVLLTNATSANEPDLVRQLVTGLPSISFEGTLAGDPRYYSDLLSTQKDLNLISSGPSFKIYNNEFAVPEVGAYSNFIVVHNMQEMEQVVTLPSFSPQETMILFADDLGVLPDNGKQMNQAIFLESNDSLRISPTDKPLMYGIQGLQSFITQDFSTIISQDGSIINIQITDNSTSDWSAGFAGNVFSSQQQTAISTFTTSPLLRGQTWHGSFNVTITPGSKVYVSNSVEERVSNLLTWGETPTTESNFGVLYRIPLDVVRSGEYVPVIRLKRDSANPLLVTVNNTTYPSMESNGWYSSSQVFLPTGKKEITVGLEPGARIEQLVLISGGALALLSAKSSIAPIHPQDNASGSFRVQVKNPSPVLLLLAESYDVGWQSFGKDNPFPHIRGDGFFNAFYVPVTHSEITITYTNMVPTVASWISVSTLMVAGAVPILQKLRRTLPGCSGNQKTDVSDIRKPEKQLS